MPKKSSSDPLVLRSRRALNAWIREALQGACIVESVTPAPVVWKEPYRAVPKPKPRIGRISLAVFPSGQPAHARVTARCFELRVPMPGQWLASQSFVLPYEMSYPRASQQVWLPVGLDLSSFRFSGDEMTVRELAPRILVIPPRYDLDDGGYAFADHSHFPSPAWWLEAALEAGFNMVAADDRGFATTVEQLAKEKWCWQFYERRPVNLRHPLSFQVTFDGDGRFRFRVDERDEEARAKVLEEALRAACERLPLLRVRSGNCDFSFAEWQRLRENRPVEPPAAAEDPEAEQAAGKIVQLDLRRRS